MLLASGVWPPTCGIFVLTREHEGKSMHGEGVGSRSATRNSSARGSRSRQFTGTEVRWGDCWWLDVTTWALPVTPMFATLTSLGSQVPRSDLGSMGTACQHPASQHGILRVPKTRGPANRICICASNALGSASHAMVGSLACLSHGVLDDLRPLILLPRAAQFLMQSVLYAGPCTSHCMAGAASK